MKKIVAAALGCMTAMTVTGMPSAAEQKDTLAIMRNGKMRIFDRTLTRRTARSTMYSTGSRPMRRHRERLR